LDNQELLAADITWFRHVDFENERAIAAALRTAISFTPQSQSTHTYDRGSPLATPSLLDRNVAHLEFRGEQCRPVGISTGGRTVPEAIFDPDQSPVVVLQHLSPRGH
jgi:hypothetical protein